MSTQEEKPKTVPKESTEKTTNKDNGETKVVDPEELIDMNTFDQLLDMDDEEDHEFSYSIVLNYFEQAEQTFQDMDGALDNKDLSELSRLGHFLKGSSAAIGLKKVKATCEKIQNIGNKQDEVGSASIDDAEALEKLTKLLPQVKEEYKEAEEYLKSFYDQDSR
ncbi:signal transduction histidine kinase [Phascolomyces articulosus]|uniref:Signal transduction histidine kinase n=1 Tax=Phascolomyces articulosus TaxID=60185 RepID=A0AAD5PE96_9FUNG|nr:signal transduction histidine kinase [Phascolomyces articulosus]